MGDNTTSLLARELGSGLFVTLRRVRPFGSLFSSLVSNCARSPLNLSVKQGI